MDSESFCSESDGNSGVHSETSSDSSSGNDSPASDGTVGEGGITDNLDTLDLDWKKTENFTKFENILQFRTKQALIKVRSEIDGQKTFSS